MYKRLLPFLLMLFFISCHKKKESNYPEMVIDYSKVDSPPIFESCKNFIDEEKEECFEETIKNVFKEELSKIQFREGSLANKNLTLKLIFNKTGKILIQKTKLYYIFVERNLELEKAIEKAVGRLSTIHPAVKQGIPVTSVYKLPIRISH